MARIRSVHPGLLTDEAFMQLTLDCPLAVTLLIGLWMEADDAGAFEWKPLTLKARILPVAPVRLDDLLDALARGDFIRRFEIGGRAFGVVRNFVKFQRPKEAQDVHPFTDESRAYAGFVDSRRPRLKIGRPSREADPGGEKVERTSAFGESPSEVCPQMEEEGGRKDPESSSSAAGASAGEIDLRQAKALPTRDLLEAEARALMGELPVVVDPDFSPVRLLLDEPGVTRADVIAGLTEAAAADFRPVSWRQLPGWVRKAAKNRIAAAASGARTGPPGGARAPPGVATRKPSGLSACLEIARGERPGGFAENSGVGAGAGPVIDGRAVAL